MTFGFLSFKSIRTKLLLLVALVALMVGSVSAIYSSFSTGKLLETQVVARGTAIASNLAFNAQYGVLTEDRPILSGLIEGATAASPDLVGVIIRDAKGATL